MFHYTEVDALVEKAVKALEQSDNKQLFIGIAGCPGSGKSTRAEEICKAINQNSKYKSKVIPMDGYHIPQEELKRMGERCLIIGDPEDTKGETTTYDDLMRRRGAPWTFDSKKLIEDLREVKSNCEGSFPIYSRDISDPVPNGVSVTKDDQIIFCEGNYILCFDDPDWAPLKEIFDEAWYIHVPEEEIRKRLVGRHLKNWTKAKEERFGKGRAGAEAKVESTDLKNARWIESNSKFKADVVINNF